MKLLSQSTLKLAQEKFSFPRLSDFLDVINLGSTVTRHFHESQAEDVTKQEIKKLVPVT